MAHSHPATREEVLEFWSAGFNEDETRKLIESGLTASAAELFTNSMSGFAVPRPHTSEEALDRLARSLRRFGRTILMVIESGLIDLGNWLQARRGSR